MDKMSLGIIYTIKQTGYSRETIARYLHDLTDTPIEYYTDEIINKILKRTMLDAITYNYHPASIVNDYFAYKDEPWDYDEFNAMCAALAAIQIRRRNPITGEYEYINGFEPMEGFR